MNHDARDEQCKKSGLRIRNFRNRAGLTQREFAEILETTIHTVSELERGCRFPSTRLAQKIVELSRDEISFSEIHFQPFGGHDSVRGQKIKIFRSKTGLTQEMLANRLGVTRESLARLESGKRGTTVKMGKKVENLTENIIKSIDFLDPNKGPVNAIRHYRISEGITQNSFAKSLGISRVSLSHYETGHRIPSLRLAIRIEKLSDGKLTVRDILRTSEELK